MEETKNDVNEGMEKLSIGESSSSNTFRKKPVVIIVVGMAGMTFRLFGFLFNVVVFTLCVYDEVAVIIYAGSGKTTFLHRLVCDLQGSKSRGYVVNLDPAVMTLPFGANIDIRDTVKYKEVMKQYNLGPNGGILTSLNLFATKFDEVRFYSYIFVNFGWCMFVLA